MITARLYSLNSFQLQYKALLQLSVSQTIKNLVWSIPEEDLLSVVNWNNMLGIASALCHSNDSKHLDAALRIAQTCLTSQTTQIQKYGAAVILESLTNQNSIKLAIDRNLLDDDYSDVIPLPFKLMSNHTRVENSVNINDSVVSLNRFQKQVYDASRDASAISISAPTSAGKSFVLYQLLIEELKEGPKNIVYIVPTRALISQVEEDLSSLLVDNDLQNVNLSTVPLRNESVNQTNLFVFTQERLHWYMQQGVDKIDFLLVDEAHKIDNSNRGILLQRKLEDVIEMNPQIKVFFSSPFTSNPELLLKDLPTSSKSSTINTEFVAVNQNLLYVTQVPRKTKLWNIHLTTQNGSIHIGHIVLDDRPTTVARKLALITKAISGNKYGNLIYANGAAESEKYSTVIQSLINQENPELPNELNELIKLVKKTIHKEYVLAKVLKNQVAFHYGNMPLLIRQEIEKLFKLNKIQYLVCTSTLLEGVNLPATAVFIRKPTRGRGQPLNENDFWNLAGRAGRWGKEFSGNIICIDPKEWGVPPSPDKRKQKIQKALDILEKDNAEEFIEFIKNGSPREEAENNQKFEFAFSYYYSRFLENKLDDKSEFNSRLINEFNQLKENIKIPNEIIFKNPGISPIAQQELLDYFHTKKDYENLIPVYPEDDDAFQEYTNLIGRIGKTLADFPYQLNASRALILIHWMTGKPLSFIISSSIANYKRKGKDFKVDQVCRNIMDEVENFARFRFAKESSCYIDILRYFLVSVDKEELLEGIPDLNLWLEFGVSQESQLSLLSLGLARNTVISLSEFLPSSEMDKIECAKWLMNIDIDSFGLSEIINRDIRKAKERLNKVVS